MQRSGKVLNKELICNDKKKIIPINNNFMNVADINKKEKKIKGERCTNPINPLYTVPSAQDPQPGWSR